VQISFSIVDSIFVKGGMSKNIQVLVAQRFIAETYIYGKVKTTPQTVRRWENRKVAHRSLLLPILWVGRPGRLQGGQGAGEWETGIGDRGGGWP
jgi:hypothetical protein